MIFGLAMIFQRNNNAYYSEDESCNKHQELQELFKDTKCRQLSVENSPALIAGTEIIEIYFFIIKPN